MNDSLKRPKILIVDDVPTNIKILVQTLRSQYAISVATSGKKALDFAEAELPDLILLDIVMPEMDGYEVCRQLKNNPKTREIPVIFITAMDDEADEMKGLEFGAVDYVTKPFSSAIVQARVSTHIGLKKAREELELRNAFIRNTFGRYMSDNIVNSILDTPDGLRLGGELKKVVIVMSDLRGFSATSERLPPETVMELLNMYLAVMTDIILKYHGTIIEIMGDGILILFGAPITREHDGQLAIACALEMQQAMTQVNVNNRERGFPDLRMGIGINAGQVVAGNIGSEKRSKYGVVGTAINIASRIESYAVGGQVLISESAYALCDLPLRIDDRFQVRSKGATLPITIFEIGAIEGPYGIHLPKPEEGSLVKIPGGMQIKFVILEEKNVGGSLHQGQVVGLSRQEAEIIAPIAIDRFSNLKLSLHREGHQIATEIYGKVVRTNQSDPQMFRVVFTSMPAEADAGIQAVIA